MCWFIWLCYSAAWFVSLYFHLRTDEINIIKLLKKIYISVKHVLMVFYIPVFAWCSKSKQNAWLFFSLFLWKMWRVIQLILLLLSYYCHYYYCWCYCCYYYLGWKCWFIDTFTGNEDKINERKMNGALWLHCRRPNFKSHSDSKIKADRNAFIGNTESLLALILWRSFETSGVNSNMEQIFEIFEISMFHRKGTVYHLATVSTTSMK